MSDRSDTNGPDARPTRMMHDALFKRVFGDADNAVALLRAIMPPEVLRHLDLPTLSLARANVVGERFDQLHGDLILSGKLKDGRDAFVWLLLEHQSTVDRWMALRLAGFTVDLLKRWVERNPRARRLPVVLPVVLYHGARPWTAATSLLDLTDLSPTAAADLGDHVLSCRYVLDDLRVTPDEALAGRDLPPYPKLGLVVLKHGRDPNLPECLARFGGELRALLATDGGAGLLGILLEYTWYVNDHIDRDELSRHLEPVAGPEVTHTIMTYAEKLVQQGIEQGIERGIEQGIERGIERGIEQGIEQGQRKVLYRQLERRFGPLPEPVVTRIEAARSGDLERWLDRVLEAGSLDEVLGA